MRDVSTDDRADDARKRGRTLAASTAILLAASALGGLFGLSLSAPVGSAADVPLTLYGTLAGGWSLTPGGETNPGPTIRVNPGDRVTLHMISEEAPGHGVFIDFNDNGRIDMGTDYSSPTGTDITDTFTVPSAPGAHYYYCSVHSGSAYDGSFVPGAPMHGLFVVNSKPAATFATPTGTTSWTGGVAHDVVFSLIDEDPPTALTVWVNYSYNGGAQAGAIAGPIPGTANPNVVLWTPTGFDATDVIINVTAVDSRGLTGWSRSSPFDVDSTAPTIAARSPDINEVDVTRNSRIRVTWSEGMDDIASGTSDAFAVSRVSDGVWISGTRSWSPDRTVMTFKPSAIWDATTTFEVHVNGTAEDDSDPGNAVAGPSTWQFTTGIIVDATPPVIATADASPAIQEAGGSVTIFANVTDDDAVATVDAHVQGPSTDVNLTMSPIAGTAWTVTRTFTALGPYSFIVWGVDPAGNAALRSGGFTIADRTAPNIASVAAIPATATPTGILSITAQVTDNAGVATVNAHVTGPTFDENLTMSLGTDGSWYVNRTYTNRGSYAFTVWAVDASGNAASGSGSFSIAQGPALPAPSGVAVHVQSNGTIIVMWAPVVSGDVTGYNVYRGASAGGPFTKLTSTPVPANGPRQYVDTTVQPGVTYYYAVTAVNGSGNESPLSTAVSAAIPGMPPADYTLWIAIAVIAAVVVLAAIAFLRRRKP